MVALIVLVLHELRMDTFKTPKTKSLSKSEVIFPTMMYIYYIYIFSIICCIYFKSHALRYIHLYYKDFTSLCRMKDPARNSQQSKEMKFKEMKCKVSN